MNAKEQLKHCGDCRYAVSVIANKSSERGSIGRFPVTRIYEPSTANSVQESS